MTQTEGVVGKILRNILAETGESHKRMEKIA